MDGKVPPGGDSRPFCRTSPWRASILQHKLPRARWCHGARRCLGFAGVMAQGVALVRRGHGARFAELQPPPGPSFRRSGRHPRWLSASAQVGAFGGTAAHFAVFAARSLLNMQLFTFSASKRKKLHVVLGLMAFHRHSDRSTRCPAVLATVRPAVLPSWQPDDRPTHRPAVLQPCRPPFLPPVRRLRRPTQSSRPDRSRRSGRWTPARAHPWRRRCPRAWCDSG